MLGKPFFVLSSPLKPQIYPHWLFDSYLADVHEKRIRQIRGTILPSRKRYPRVLRINGPHANAERTGVLVPARPSLPKQSASCAWTLSLAWMSYPNQLDHGVGKSEAPTRCTLPGMLIGRSLMQTELNKFFRLGTAGRGTDKEVV